jgi:hypothetical protein
MAASFKATHKTLGSTYFPLSIGGTEPKGFLFSEKLLIFNPIKKIFYATARGKRFLNDWVEIFI